MTHSLKHAAIVSSFWVGLCLSPLVAAQGQETTPNTVDQLTPMTVLAGTPEIILTVKPKAGTCPKEIWMWQKNRYYEGGGETGIVVDLRRVAASSVRFFASSDRFVSYKAPLKPAYATCQAQAISKDFPYYKVWFQSKQVYFRFDMDAIPQHPLTEITHQSIYGGNPYVQWAIAD
ncbi:MAG: hypothetical protein KME16_03845 [Scytolyngbya sp. HA4215-MV1]|nr:hypothetical protein [Scytolyngbya sp. HA4215-MV1]